MKIHALSACLLLLPSFLYSEQLLRVTMRDVAKRLIQDGVLVCLESVHNQLGDEITVGKRIEILQAIPEGDRTEIEQLRLASSLEMKATGKSEDIIVDWTQQVIDFDYPDTPFCTPDILDMLIFADPSYSWTMIGTRYIIFPRAKSFDCEIEAFAGNELNIDDFMLLGIEKIIRPSNLYYQHIGPIRDWRWKYTNASYSINLPAGRSRAALTLFCDALGPQFLWQVWGIETYGIMVSITPANIQRNTTEQGAAANP